MRWQPLLALAVVAACVAPQSVEDTDPEVLTRVLRVSFPIPIPRRLDMLFVIDDSPAIAPHRANLLANFPAMMAVFDTLQGGRPDLRLAVTTTSTCNGLAGRLHSTGVVQGAFIMDSKQPDGARRGNYTGTLGNAFAELADVGASGCAQVTAFAAMRAALSDPSTGFVRPDAQLMVVFITASDDHSPDDVANDVAFLRSMKTDPSAITVAGITGPREGTCAYAGATAESAPRIGELLDAFPNRSTFTTICQRSLTDGLVLFGGFDHPTFGDPCFARPLAEPIECAVWFRAPNYERVIARCTDVATPGPCWRIEDSAVNCPGSDRHELLQIRLGVGWPPARTEAVAQCLAQ